MTDSQLRGDTIISALKAAGIEFVAALPDITTSEGMLWPLSKRTDFRLVRLCKEDEGVSICSGLAAAGKRAVLMMQNTGFLDSVNCIRAVAVEYEQPVCMIVGLLGKDPNKSAAKSDRYSVRLMEPLIDVMGIDRLAINSDADVPQLPAAIDRAYAASRPLVVLLGRTIQP